MTARGLISGALMLFAAAWAAGDSIVIDGVMYDNVIVREGSSQYYVQLPADGRTLSVAKSGVKPEDVVLSKDQAKRKELLAAWTQKNAERPESKDADKAVAKRLPRRPSAKATEHAPDPPLKSDSVPGSAPSGAMEQVRSAAGGATVETGTFSDEKGVKRLVVKGNREKDEGFEGRVEQQRAAARAQRAAAQAAAEEAAMPVEEGDVFYDAGDDGAAIDGSPVNEP